MPRGGVMVTRVSVNRFETVKTHVSRVVDESWLGCQGPESRVPCWITGQRVQRAVSGEEAANVLARFTGLARTAVEKATSAEGVCVMASVGEVARIELRSWPDRDRLILTVTDELDLCTVGAARAALGELYAAHRKSIVLDLRKLTFIDSAGSSLLLAIERAAQRAGAAFAIVDGSPALARLVEVIGLGEQLARARVR